MGQTNLRLLPLDRSHLHDFVCVISHADEPFRQLLRPVGQDRLLRYHGFDLRRLRNWNLPRVLL